MKTIQEQYLESLEWFKERITIATKGVFEEHGFCTPVFFALMSSPQKKKRVDLAIIPLAEFHSKDEIAFFIKMFIMTYTPLATALVTEAWFKLLEVEPEDRERILRETRNMVVSEEPDRIEAVSIMMETYAMECICILKIIRPENSKPKLEELEMGGPAAWKKTNTEEPKRFNALYQKTGVNFSEHLEKTFQYSHN